MDPLTPLLARRIDLGPVFEAHPAQILGEFIEPRDPNRVEPTQLLTDPELRNLTRIRLARTRILIREACGLETAALEIFALITEPLAA